MQQQLRPEQRVDRNGRLVTRHVRTAPKASTAASGIPVSSLPSAPAAPEPYRPRPKQLERGHFGLFLPMESVPSEALWDSPDEGEGVRRRRHSYGAENVNMVEIYDVISAVGRPADALKLLSRGVRSADEARAYLAERNAQGLAADRTASARRALETNLHPHDYIQWYDKLAGEGRREEDVVDAVRLAASSLWEDDYFYRTAFAIADGEISFEDIKTVGISRFKPHKRLRYFHGALKLIRSADGDDYTAEDLKTVALRATEEKLDDVRHQYLGRLLVAAGTKRVAEVDPLSSVVEPFIAFANAIGHPEAWTDEEAAERALYHASLGDAVTVKDHEKWRVSTEFYAAGIPADVAREVILSGGTVATAQGIHDQGVNRAVADGWL